MKRTSVFQIIGNEIQEIKKDYRNFHVLNENDLINNIRELNQEFIPFLIPGAWVNGLGYLRSLGRKGYQSVVFDSSGRDISLFSKYAIPFRYEISKEPDKKYENLFRTLIRIGESVRNCGKKPVLLIIAAERMLPTLVGKYFDELNEIFTFTADYKNQLNLENKYLQIEKAKEAGIDVPISFLIRSNESLTTYIKDLKFPLIIKSNSGKDFYDQYGVQVFRIKNLIELEEILQRVEHFDLLVQEEIPGEIENLKTFGGYFGHDRSSHGIFTGHKLRNSKDFGTCAIGISCEDNIVKEKGLAFLNHVNYFGACQIEFKKDSLDGKLKFIEINNRLWKWHSLATESGVDLAYMQFSDAIGDATHKNPRQIDGIKWWLSLLDISNAIDESKKGEMSLNEYFDNYLDLDFVDGIFAWDDPLPGLINFFNGKWIK